MKKSILSAALLATPIFSNAAGFALIEQSGSGMGNAYAGAAAIAEDASTIYFNPAGMTYIEGTQVVGALHIIKPSGEFNDEGSLPGATIPLGNRPRGGGGGNIGGYNFVPNFYYKRDITDAVKFGLGVGAPFGLKTEYDRDWVGRFQGVKSDLKTVNINPALAFKVNDQLSLGFGINAMWIQAELTSGVNLGNQESNLKVKGDDWGFGYNLGAIYQVTPDTRFGLAFRSKVDQQLTGDSKSPFTGLDADPNRRLNGDVTAETTLPETLSLSSFTQLNDQWDLLGDVTWTRWSRFRELRVLRENGSTLTVTPQNWDNTMRYSIALNFKYSDTLKLRVGVAYDEEAIKDEFRTVRIPGNDRKWLAFGVNWKATPSTSLDIGYAHLFISNPDIDDNQTTTTAGVPGRGRVTGDYDASVDMLSMQVTHNF
jgi:long-chain fatty acid transport protein